MIGVAEIKQDPVQKRLVEHIMAHYDDLVEKGMDVKFMQYTFVASNGDAAVGWANTEDGIPSALYLGRCFSRLL